MAVTLAVAGAGGERQLERDAERLRALVGYACEQAELGGNGIGLSFDRGGYRFSRAGHADWTPIGQGELRARHWSVSARTTLTRGGHAVEIGADFPGKPQLVCFSSGELTAFTLDLGMPESATLYRVEGQPDGRVDAHVVNRRAP